MSKIDDAKQKIIDAQSIQSLITIALDAGDDSDGTTEIYFASKVAEERLSDAMRLLEEADFEVSRAAPA